MGNIEKKLELKKVLATGYQKAIASQYSVAVANVNRLRRVHPEMTPTEMIKYLNKLYLGTVGISGAGAGAAAAAPNGVFQIPVAIAEFLGYLEASVLYAYSVMVINKLHPEDVERRVTIVTTILIGNSAITTLERVLGETAPVWGKQLVKAIPNAAIKKVNLVLRPQFIVKWGTTRGVLVLGKQVPLWIGAVVGSAGNVLFGNVVIKSAKKILGPAPASWDETTNLEHGKLANLVEKKAVAKKSPARKITPAKAPAKPSSEKSSTTK
jgi:hypothetical protein